MKKRNKLKIYLFRHGQTTYNRDRKFTGWKNPPLTAEGIKHAKTIAKELKNKTFQVAFHTHLKRSKDTLKEVLKFHPECVCLIENDLMIERNYGDLNGKTHKSFIHEIGKKDFNFIEKGDALENLDPKTRKKIEEILGEAEYNLIHRGWNSPPPGGESFKMVEKRVRKFIKLLKKFMKKNKVNVAISAHGNSIRLFRKIMERATIAETCKWFIPYDKVFSYEI